MPTFFDLPPELCNMIYSFAVIRPKPIALTTYNFQHQGLRYFERKPLCVNRQFYAEWLEAFYSFNAFESCSFEDAKACLIGLDPKRLAWMRDVRIFGDYFSTREEQIEDVFHQLNSLREILEDNFGGFRRRVVSVRLLKDGAVLGWEKLEDIEEFEVIVTGEKWHVERRRIEVEAKPTFWRTVM